MLETLDKKVSKVEMGIYKIELIKLQFDEILSSIKLK